MRKQIEFGCGNTWLLRTEFEASDGTEREVKGISGDILIKSVYLRVWIGQTVYILDVKEGFKRQRKMSNVVKFVVGIASEVI